MINFFFYVAEDLRRSWPSSASAKWTRWSAAWIAWSQRTDVDHWKAKGIDLSAVLYNPPMPSHVGRRCTQAQDHGLEDALDGKLIEHDAAKPSRIARPSRSSMPIRNVHRTVGTMLSGEIARRYGSAGLPDDTIRVQFTGCAGQSFGAFLAKGVTLTLEGEANDYVGKGLSGGRLVIYPPRNSQFRARGKYSDRQRVPLRRDERRGVLQRHGRRALRGAQFRRHGRRRRRRRSRLRIHDATAWSSCSAERAAISPPE